MINKRKIKKAAALAVLFCFTSLTGAQPLYAIPANTALPTGGEVIVGIGGVEIPNEVTNNTLNITQNVDTSVIKWENFSIGADATVNFIGANGQDFTGHNSLNFVNSGNVSEIYGQLNAVGGNIFIANTAGVQIGNSAQINVGSLYVTNRDLSNALADLNSGSTTDDVIDTIQRAQAGNAELMSLGSIISPKVTFDGSRIVIDTDRLYKNRDAEPIETQGLTVRTTGKDDVVLGYDAYDDATSSYPTTAKSFGNITVVDGDGNVTEQNASVDGYMWVRDLFQLQNMNTNLGGRYALRNSIDANYTANMNDDAGFAPIGDNINRFTGRFDGLGYSIFGLNISRPDETNVGLFGYLDDGAYVRNFTLNSGTIFGGTNVGAAVGHMTAGSVVENITNTANVKGTSFVGGIVGTVSRESGEPQRVSLMDLINVGTVEGDNVVGGIIGVASYADIGGTTYNLGSIRGTSDNSFRIGGIVGSANNVAIGNAGDGFQIYNQASVTGGHDVGGIAGYLSATNISDGSTSTTGKSTIQNVANHGTITATGADVDAYNYHTADNDYNLSGISTSVTADGVATVQVKVANAGGIVGKSQNSGQNEGQNITISNVLNDGDVSSSLADGQDYRTAGNVGGIVGSANDTAIEDATNRENSVAGAHNVGGIAGLLTGKSHITNGTNDGGDITGTGARLADGSGFAKERVRPLYSGGGSNETFIIGNIGGVAGYLYDSDSKADGEAEAYIENSTNRGTVHSAYITDEMLDSGNLPDIVKAANVGGVAGKVDSGVQLSIDGIMPDDPNAPNVETDFQKVSIRHSYNTGEVQGYTGVGGIAGMMYNGSVARSFNTGKITSTRQSNNNTIEPLNMGGIVGDTTEGTTDVGTVLYDVYNAGQIGDETYTYYGRHVGGVVGRLTGTLYKAYNTGDIYNGFSVTGGIVGWWNDGNISYVFNTGNVTGLNKNVVGDRATGSYVGGIVGGVYIEQDKTLKYAYNLGTIRSFSLNTALNDRGNYVSGIIGAIEQNSDNNNFLTISNVYTLGNIYAATGNEETGFEQDNGNNSNSNLNAVWNGSYWGKEDNPNVSIENVYYIAPEDPSLFTDLSTTGFGTNFNKAIAFADKSDVNEYSYTDSNGRHSMTIATPGTSVGEDGKTADILEDEDNPWRLYSSTPILNVFMPYAEDYFSEHDLPEGVTSIQYGTAYNPLLTIINTDKDITLDWNDLQITGAAGLAVYGGGLTLTNFQANNGYYYGGTIYSDGALKIEAAGNHSGTFTITDGARLYGSSVEIDTNGNDALISGTIQATGNDGDGSVTITSGKDSEDGSKDSDADIEILGQLISAKEGDTVTVDSITSKPDEYKGWGPQPDDGSWEKLIRDPEFTGLPTYAEMYEHTTGTAAATNGDVTVETAGSASILYGNMEAGAIRSYGDFNVTAGSGIYLDSVMDLGRDLNLTSDGEIILDFASDGSISHIHDFVNHFNKETGTGAVNIKGEGNFIIGLDMWNDETSRYDITKFNKDGEVGTGADLQDGLDAMKVQRIDEEGNVNSGFTYDASKYVYLWVEDAYQLKGIQDYVEKPDEAVNAETFLGYNFALKDNIDASVLSEFKSIGTTTEDGFSGIFDGRGFRILGLNVGSGSETSAVENAGIFTKIAAGGTVRDLRVYASNFYGTNAAGAIAGENNGTITGVTTLGNRVDASGGNTTIEGVADVNGAAGGVAGVNKGTITEINASDIVVANGKDGKQVTAGGVAGINSGTIGTALNENGELPSGVTESVITADSAVTASSGSTYSLGGVTGVNTGTVTLADSTGVTNGRAGVENFNAEHNVGGIAGVNDGTMVSLYNESIIMGKSEVGGVAGVNNGEMRNAVNATTVTSTNGTDSTTNAENTGGIAGKNTGTISGGRNAGAVQGVDNVGGMVGSNTKKADGSGGILENLSNAIAATINGTQYVGGIAGVNDGDITSDSNLTNEGTVTGTNYVGGVAGQNNGSIVSTGEGLVNRGTVSGLTNVGGIAGDNAQDATITNVTSETLVLKTRDGNANNFGGIAGTNSGTITNATNNSDVTADGAKYVGGIVGENTSTGTLVGELTNNGDVKGSQNVGGLAGINHNIKLLQGKQNDDNTITRLVVTNTGIVSGTDSTSGSAGGIFYENTGDILNADLVNKGTVTGSGSGATGGLFGVNSGKITNSTLTNSGIVTGGGTTGGLIGENTGEVSKGSVLTNSGEVTGGDKTGGLFGSNSGNVSGSSLINEAGAKVTGQENTGGLIGYNTGEITGGRAKADNDMEYYADRIVNNGNVSGSSNVGGLIGTNVDGGKLTAGYNTGAVKGTGDNVGGIAGTNAGTIDQVFNTVMTADATADTEKVTEEIHGTSNVGGIVGNNSGTLTNAYNDTETIVATAGDGAISGNAVGTNAENAKIENVYATNTKGSLVGNGAGSVSGSYSFSNADGDKTGVTVIAEGKRNDKTSYTSFTDANVWKFYDGYNTPLLKVFLTEAEYNGTIPNFVYNGRDQGLDVSNVTAADDLPVNNLLEALVWKNAGTGYLAFGSGQIIETNADGVFNPNNLGYDIDVTFDIAKAQLNITLDDISRVYGNATIKNDTVAEEGQVNIRNEAGYGFTYGVANGELTDKMKAELDEAQNFGFNITNDGAVADLAPGKTTNNANADGESYNWSADFTLSEEIANNYAFAGQAEDAKSLSKTDGKSTVNKADLHVTLDTVERTYGDAALTNEGGKYAIKDGEEHLAFVNGDSYNKNDFTVSNIKDEAVDDLAPGKTTTNNVGSEYKWAGTVSGNEDTDINANYNIIVDGEGQSIVDKADLTITMDDIERTYGDTTIQSGGYGIKENGVSSLVNGDEKSTLVYNHGYHHDGALVTVKGEERTNGVRDGGYTWTVDKERYGSAFTGVDGLTNNYNITVVDGKSTVTPKTLSLGELGATIVYGNQDGAGFLVTGGDWLNAPSYNDDVRLDTDLSSISENLTGEYEANRGGRVTADVGSYENSIIFSGLSLTGEKAGNYRLADDTVTGGVTVTPAKLSISADDQSVMLGVPPVYTGTTRGELAAQLVNGDAEKLGGFGYVFGVEDETTAATVGVHRDAIGLFIGETFLGGGTYSNWSGYASFFANYEVTVAPGDLTVGTISNWGFLHTEWSRIENFRERKAEVNFVDGGMEYEEGM